jgi:hypothetical protein
MGPLPVIFAGRALHAKHRGVEVARLGIVRARIGDVIDADHLEAAGCLGIGGIARAANDGCDRNGLAEFSAVQFTFTFTSKSLTRPAMKRSMP